MSLSVLSRVKVCHLDDLPVGLGRAFAVANKQIAIFRTRAGRVFATAAQCPHKGGPLADGMLGVNDQIVCPYHQFRYDSTNGECDQTSVCSVEVFPVEIVDGGVIVTL